MEAESGGMSYMDYTIRLFSAEADHREEKDLLKRTKAAMLPINYNLDIYDYAIDNGLSKTRLMQLRELLWIEQLFNVVLMGPSGTGKTFIDCGIM